MSPHILYQTGSSNRATPRVLLQATKLVIITEPSGAVNRVAWTGQPAVQLQDAFGLNVRQSGISVTLSLTQGAAILSGTVTVATDANGTATFSGLTLTGTAGTHGLQATSTGLTTAVSAAFDLAAGAPATLVLAIEPSGAVAGAALTQQPQLRLRDIDGNTVAQSSVSITVTKHAGVVGTLSGTASAGTDATGLAIFTDLAMSAVETGVRLDFASAGLTGIVSAAFDVATPPSSESLPLFSEPFSDTNFANRGWYSIVSTDWVPSPAPAGFNGSFRINWPVGQALAPNSGGMRKLFTPTDTLYIRYQQAFSANWIGNGSASGPHLVFALSDVDGAFAGPSDNFLALYSEVNYQSGNIGWVRFQDNQYIDPANIGANVGEARGTSGANAQQGYADSWDLFASGAFSQGWYATRNLKTATVINAPGDTAFHTIEVEVFLNTIVGGIGQLDGIVRYWVDGTLRYERTNLIMRTGSRPTLKFNQFMFSPNMNDPSPVNQTTYIADLQVRTRRPVTVATKLGMATQPSGAIDNALFTTQPAVQVQDATGASVSESGVTITASILTGTGSLIGTLTATTNAGGLATFTSLGINATTPPADFTLQFSAPGLTGVASAVVTVGAGGGGGGTWLANKPVGAIEIATLVLADQSLSGAGFNQIGAGPWFGDNIDSRWSKVADYWMVTKPPGSYGTPTGGSSWGDFYLSLGTVGPIPNKVYVAIELMWTSDNVGLGYEWHPISNKWMEFDSGGVFLLVQANEENGARWQWFEQLGADYHPANNISNAAIPSNVKVIYEAIVEYNPVSRLRSWRDGAPLADLTGAPLPAPGGYLEFYIHNFDGGGGNTRTRTSYIRYYRISLWRF